MKSSQLIFVASTFYIFYVVVLHPLLVAAIARIHPKPVLRAPYTPSISLIVPVYNGEHFIKEKLNSIFALDYPPDRMQILIVNDGSTDLTRHIAASFGSRLTLVDLQKAGKAAALKTGIAAATGEILVFSDVRQVLAPESLRLLLENFADPSVAAVSAELQIRSGTTLSEASTGIYWKYERWIRLHLSAIDSIFGATGSYYALRRPLAPLIPDGVLADDMFLPMPAFLLGKRLIVDRRAKMYDYPTTASSEFVRKVRTLAGVYQILRYYPALLTPRNRMLFHFVSYKLGRLLLPFAFLACAISSVWAGGLLMRISIVAQAIVYSLALLEPSLPEGMLLKRIASPLKTSLLMLAAAFCAISIWFVPPERLWRATRVNRRAAA